MFSCGKAIVVITRNSCEHHRSDIAMPPILFDNDSEQRPRGGDLIVVAKTPN